MFRPTNLQVSFSSLSPRASGYRGLSCPFIPSLCNLAGYKILTLSPYTLSSRYTGVLNAYFVSLYPLLTTHQGIECFFCLAIPSPHDTPGYRILLLSLYALSSRYTGVLNAYFVSLYPLLTTHQGIECFFCLAIPSPHDTPGYRILLLSLYTPPHATPRYRMFPCPL